MSTTAANEDNDLPSKDRSFGFLTLGRRNFFSSNSFISDTSQIDRRRPPIQKSWSQAGSFPSQLKNEYMKIAAPKQWNQPTGLVAQILQEKRDALIENLKKKVKVLAEESVTRNFIHEQSSNITAFCAAVDDCLRFGLALKKPMIFNRESPTYSLLKEVSKSLREARDIVNRVQEMEENAAGNGGYGNAFNFDSAKRNASFVPAPLPKYLWIRIALFQKSLDKVVDHLIENAESYYERVSIIAHPFDGHLFADLLRGPCTHDYTRIRTSDHLWTDPSAGELMQRKMLYSAGVQGTQHLDTIQREGVESEKQLLGEKRAHLHERPRLSLDSGIGAISANHHQPAPPTPADVCGRFFLHIEPDVISPATLLYQVASPPSTLCDNEKNATSNAVRTEKRAEQGSIFDGLSMDDESHYYYHQSHSIFSTGSGVQKLTQAKDYVESLYQNERAPLLYGKNNVVVQPSMSATCISGYLSIHKTGLDDDFGLQLKWAPNRAMSVIQASEEQQQQPKQRDRHANNCLYSHNSTEDPSKRMLHESNYWDFALEIDIKKVVYIHCHRHQFDNDGGTVILVREDGVQYPPLTFPAFSHVISFIQCLEMHLAPRGFLNPRTDDVDWSGSLNYSRINHLSDSVEVDGGTPSSPSIATPTQFCFRIDTVEISPVIKQESNAFRMFTSTLRGSTRVKMPSTDNLTAASKLITPMENLPQISVNAIDAFSSTYLAMQHQILSRVFNGWLAYTRSINLIRNRLQGLVYPRCLLPNPPPLDPEPLTSEFWQKVRLAGMKVSHIREVYRRIYYGGCDPNLRREVWPFLLGHYPWSASAMEIEEIDRQTRMIYERSVSEWLAAEVIVQQQHRQRKSGTGTAVVSSQRAPATRSRSVSVRRESFTSDKQTVEDILSDAWNRVKRRISIAAGTSSKLVGELNGNSNDSLKSTDSTRTTSGLPPLPSKYNHGSRAFKINSSGVSCHNSVDLTDDLTEDCTLTTTDDDDVLESAAAANRFRRLAMARAQSCPNSPRSLPDHHRSTAPISTTISFGINQEGSSDIDEFSEMSTFALKRNGGDHVSRLSAQSMKERKQSRYLRAEVAGATYSSEVLEALSVNIQRIDKDVARCDRNYPYFSKGLSSGDGAETAASEQSLGGLHVASLDLSANLYRLRTIMCTWIWQHMETGYVQGMCDLLAPLLVVLEDEALTYACFSQLMLKMLANFPLASGTALTSSGAAAAAGVLLPHLLETVVVERAPNRQYEFTRPMTKHQLLQGATIHCGSNGHRQINMISGPGGSARINRQFESLRNLIEVLDPVLADHMHLNEDNSHLYFYRWLLLDFKREFKYADVFLAWETIWTSFRLVCQDFEIFIAFALIQYYRDIIIFYCFDYTDIIRFYNERAEQHDLTRLLNFARDLIYRLQTIISSVRPKSGSRTRTLPSEY